MSGAGPLSIVQAHTEPHNDVRAVIVQNQGRIVRLSKQDDVE